MTRHGTLLAIVVAVFGCSDDEVDPITKVTGPRVLAVVTEPSALPLDGSIQLTAITVDPDGPRSEGGGRPVDAVRMRACAPWKFIADPVRDCGADALPLSPDSSGQIVVTAEQLAAAFPSPPGVVAPPDPWRVALAAGLELRVPIIVEVDVDGQTIVARRDIHVVETAGERQNPIFSEIRFDGIATQTLQSGQRYDLTATVDPASLDAQDGDDPDRVLETVDCYFYSAAGDLAEPEVDIEEPDAPVPETEPNAYTAGPAGSTWMFVVATDETGGMAVDWISLTIE